MSRILSTILGALFILQLSACGLFASPANKQTPRPNEAATQAAHIVETEIARPSRTPTPPATQTPVPPSPTSAEGADTHRACGFTHPDPWHPHNRASRLRALCPSRHPGLCFSNRPGQMGGRPARDLKLNSSNHLGLLDQFCRWLRSGTTPALFLARFRPLSLGDHGLWHMGLCRTQSGGSA